MAALAQTLDARLLDSAVGTGDSGPDPITQGITTAVSSGSTLAQIDADLKLLITALISGGSNLVNAIWILSPTTATYLASLRGTGGIPAFPAIGVNGGTLLGLPVIVSAGCSGQIVLLDQSRLVIADEGRATVKAAQDGGIQLLDNPSGGASGLISLWQNELFSVRATRYVNWTMRESSSIAVLGAVSY